MNAKVVKLPRPAERDIDRVLGEFLDEQRARLAPKTLAKYGSVLDLLRRHLNGYAYQGLSKPDAALFERYHSAEGEAQPGQPRSGRTCTRREATRDAMLLALPR